MRLAKWIVIGVIVLPAAEMALVLAIAAALGWPATLTLLLATSVVGLGVLRRAGGVNMAALRRTTGPGGTPGSFVAEGRLHLLAAGILLLIPGFITDLIGTLTLVGPLRRRFGATLGRVVRDPRAAAGSRQRVIDLEPDEWHQLPDDKPRRQSRRR